MPKKNKRFSVTVALRAVVGVPVMATSLEEAGAVTVGLSDVASFGRADLHDYRLDVVGVSEDTGWDILND